MTNKIKNKRREWRRKPQNFIPPPPKNPRVAVESVTREEEFFQPERSRF
jgi:hypothetical protein